MRGLALVTLLSLSTGCGDPERPVFQLPDDGSADENPPVILFAPADSIVTIGETLTVSVRVIDRTGIARVAASASGVLSVGFPASQPNDTVFDAQYPIPTANASPGPLNFTVVASDLLGNQATGLQSFELR